MPNSTLLTVFASLALLGCAENAVLELDIIPPESSGTLTIQILSSDEVIDAPEDLGGDFVDVPLDDEAPEITIIAETEDEIGDPLYLGLAICDVPPCLPTRLLRVERAFYLGEYTHLDIDLRRIPLTGFDVISRCQVQGCGRSEGDYCYLDPAEPGRPLHFCER